MVMEHQLSERRACALVGLSRDSYRNPAVPSVVNQQLTAQIIEIAHARRRAGYRMIHDLLRPERSGINHKRIYRLYSDAGLAVRGSDDQSNLEHGLCQRQPINRTTHQMFNGGQ